MIDRSSGGGETVTGQISDKVVYGDTTFSLVEADGTGLFDPKDFGLKAIPTSTANWRGFKCRYVVEESQLILESVRIGLEEPSRLFSQDPEPKTDSDIATNEWTYSALAQPVAFSGELTLGDGFIRELYDHIGFQPAWRYRTVLRMKFDNGQLKGVADVSNLVRRPGSGTANVQPVEAEGEPTE